MDIAEVKRLVWEWLVAHPDTTRKYCFIE